MQYVTHPVSLPYLYCRQDIPFLLDSMQYFFILHMIGTSDLLHPAPANFKTHQVFLIHFLKCPSSNTRQCHTPNVALY